MQIHLLLKSPIWIVVKGDKGTRASKIGKKSFVCWGWIIVVAVQIYVIESNRLIVASPFKDVVCLPSSTGYN